MILIGLTKLPQNTGFAICGTTSHGNWQVSSICFHNQSGVNFWCTTKHFRSLHSDSLLKDLEKKEVTRILLSKVYKIVRQKLLLYRPSTQSISPCFAVKIHQGFMRFLLTAAWIYTCTLSGETPIFGTLIMLVVSFVIGNQRMLAILLESKKSARISVYCFRMFLCRSIATALNRSSKAMARQIPWS